jgi:hypothetical protein
MVSHMPSAMTTARKVYITLSMAVVAENTGPTVRRQSPWEIHPGIRAPCGPAHTWARDPGRPSRPSCLSEPGGTTL